ncbi:chorismate pyruvate-lyase family protein [Clostridium sp. DJ247]|uniref:chorismate pyruvate-lyase family protein n=1 Tax=Clostridium sp. DJ247 TaxID=2726188 RepID=UPI0016256E35|nr:chorismate pyruvate-lyase family protein [Clostridium sp. DJ247]MBC2581722.1 DUF98 domain-containing protein [Clostridium sp. DJ247]
MIINNDITLDYPHLKQAVETKLAKIILFNDGSTTRLLETLVGDKVVVDVHIQDLVSNNNLPKEGINYFKGDGPYLFRIASLYYNEEVLSNNVVIVPKNMLNLSLHKELKKGKIPLGKLINEIDYRRNLISGKTEDSTKLKSLFAPYELEHGIYPVKKYTINRNGECWFYICEVFHYKTILKYFIKNDIL